MAMVKSNLNTKDLVRDYKKGFSLRKIAEIHFSNRTTVREKLIEAGVYKRTTISDKLSKSELIMLLSKAKVIEIAKLFKVSERTIYNLIKKYNIKENQPDGRESRGAKTPPTVRQTNTRNQSKPTKRKTAKNRAKSGT